MIETSNNNQKQLHIVNTSIVEITLNDDYMFNKALCKCNPPMDPIQALPSEQFLNQS